MFYVAWENISKNVETYINYLEEFVYECTSRQQYLKKMNASVLDKLKAKSRMSQGVDYGY